ncbi:hypothetical protein AB0K16_03875 [Nonomuraea jabiensis]
MRDLVFNYFPTKEDALFAEVVESMEQMADVLDPVSAAAIAIGGLRSF